MEIRLGGLGSAASTKDVETLGEHLFEICDRAPLHQHVPVGTSRLDLLGLRLRAVDQDAAGAVQAALPRRRDLGFLGERDRELVPAGTAICGHIARSWLSAVLGLVADSAQPTASQRSICHGAHLPDNSYNDSLAPNLLTTELTSR